jgi:hypothetical protein
VRIGYETPWRQVEAILIDAAGRTPGLLKDPEPFVQAMALGEFAIDYQINAYTGEPTRMVRIRSELHRNILDVFNEHGVQIMTPAYEGDPEQPKIVPRTGGSGRRPPAREAPRRRRPSARSGRRRGLRADAARSKLAASVRDLLGDVQRRVPICFPALFFRYITLRYRFDKRASPFLMDCSGGGKAT